jgi:hypothetical protein
MTSSVGRIVPVYTEVDRSQGFELDAILAASKTLRSL